MRFLHTADWHVGKNLRGRSRLEEYGQILVEILDIAVRERVQCVLVAGDVFDSQSPPPDAERLVYDFFAELIGRKISAVVIGGNHDHPKRLAALRAVLDPLNVHIRGEARDAGVIQVVRDSETARVAVLPWVSEAKLVETATLFGPQDTWFAVYAEDMARIVKTLTQGADVLVAHLSVHGAEAAGSERAIHLTAPYAVNRAAFPATLGYAALGHLHRPQQIDAPCPLRYAGSPLQLDFGEQGERKGVVLVETRRSGPARVEPVWLTAGRQLREVKGTRAEVERFVAGDEYLKVIVTTEGPDPGLAEEIRNRFPGAVSVSLDYPKPPEEALPLRGLSPPQLFEAWYRRERGEPPAGLVDRFLSVYEECASAAD